MYRTFSHFPSLLQTEVYCICKQVSGQNHQCAAHALSFGKKFLLSFPPASHTLLTCPLSFLFSPFFFPFLPFSSFLPFFYKLIVHKQNVSWHWLDMNKVTVRVTLFRINIKNDIHHSLIMRLPDIRVMKCILAGTVFMEKGLGVFLWRIQVLIQMTWAKQESLITGGIVHYLTRLNEFCVLHFLSSLLSRDRISVFWAEKPGVLWEHKISFFNSMKLI